jgi:cystathionine beta-synthase
LTREEGILAGGSCGTALVAAREVVRDLTQTDGGESAVVVVLLPDSGRSYLSKIYNDEWMADYGFLASDSAEPKIAEVLGHKRNELPEFVHAHPDETVSAAIGILREYNVSQLPVMKEEPPVMAAEVVGSVVERDLLDALVSGRASPKDPVGQHMSPPLPMVGSGEPIGRAVDELEKAGAALVLVDGRPAAMITAQDVLTFLAGSAA